MLSCIIDYCSGCNFISMAGLFCGCRWASRAWCRQQRRYAAIRDNRRCRCRPQTPHQAPCAASCNASQALGYLPVERQRSVAVKDVQHARDDEPCVGPDPAQSQEGPLRETHHGHVPDAQFAHLREFGWIKATMGCGRGKWGSFKDTKHSSRTCFMTAKKSSLPSSHLMTRYEMGAEGNNMPEVVVSVQLCHPFPLILPSH